MKTYANAKILKWARERKQFSIPLIAKKIRKPENEIISWEDGTDSPSYAILERLAYQYYKVPLAVFYFPDPPNIENPKTKMRRLPDYEFERISPDTLHMINFGLGYQQSLIRLLGLTNNDNTIFKALKNEHKSHIHSLCSLVRQYLGITIEQQIKFTSFESAFKAWRHAIELGGIYTFKDSFEDKFISGFSLIHPEYPIIFINNSNSFTRQIFTLIHELAHILFGVNGISDIDDRYFEMMSQKDKEIEIKCNRFAGEFLVPIEIIQSELRGINNFDDMFFTRFSRKYKISRIVILRRLLDIDKITNNEYDFYVNKWNREYFRPKHEKSGGDYYLTRLAYIGEGFAKLAYTNYRSGKISNVELGQHLNINSKHIAKLGTYLK